MEIMNMSVVNRIAIVRLSAMGDCILLQPTVLRILDYFPEVQIDWYIDKAWASLFPKIPRLNLIPIQKPKGFKDYLALRRDYFHVEYDVLLAMQASFRSNLIYSFVRAPIKIGFDRHRARDGQWLWTNRRIPAGEDHLADGFARFADVMSVPPAPMVWKLARPQVKDLPALIQDALEQARPIVGFLPAASKLERTPLSCFWVDMLEAFEKLHQHKLGQQQPLFLLLGGPTDLEKQLAKEIQKGAKQADVINFVGRTSLFLLAGILEHITCLVSPDSGPAHLANALQTPVIGLYAVAPSKLSGPYSYPELTFDVFDQAVIQFLHKKPHEVPWGTRVHNRKAMGLISAQRVAERVLALVWGEC